jgi:aldehyde:ferredoxin oxidoreductase
MIGHAGKILRINLSDRRTSTIDTRDYEMWVGGHALGSAVFWDLVKDKTIDGFHADNVVTIMTSPLSGTLTPAGSARCEVQGIGVQSSPIGWFTRSNFGGRFAPMLKFAGWDGIVIEGKADRPVWIDIRNDKVTFKEARSLWGLDTWKTQDMIWKEVSGRGYGNWFGVDPDDRTTQRPAVLTIGPAGERLGRVGCLVHDAGNAAGQGGFGGIWGAKNLKAISVIGTGAIRIADPKGLMDARLWAQRRYSTDLANLDASRFARFGRKVPQIQFWDRIDNARLQACVGCHLGSP